MAAEPSAGTRSCSVHETNPDRKTSATEPEEDPELEATQLRDLNRVNEARELGDLRLVSIPTRSTIGPDARFYKLQVFWKRHISVHVRHDTCRDHLGIEA
ncbi:hypothetical protein MRB53_037052 [Persea americana]|nr:hypothetical protein MRB53_037052 [Persea americana]